jgi:hypothetical protein
MVYNENTIFAGFFLYGLRKNCSGGKSNLKNPPESLTAREGLIKV